MDDNNVPVIEFMVGKAGKYRYPLDKSTLQKIRQKHVLVRKLIGNNNPEVRTNCNGIRSQVGKNIRKVRKQLEKELAKKAKSNPKPIRNYVK